MKKSLQKKKKKNDNIVVRGEIFPQKLTALKERHPEVYLVLLIPFSYI